MDEQTFWDFIEQTRQITGDNNTLLSNSIFQRLIQLTDTEIFSFCEHLIQNMNRAYLANLWNAASVITCGCSDDGFKDFRAWLISQGKQTFEIAISDPDSLADVVQVPYESRNESFYYESLRAYVEKTKVLQFPYPGGSPISLDKPDELTDDSETLRNKFPKLFRKFGDCGEMFND